MKSFYIFILINILTISEITSQILVPPFCDIEVPRLDTLALMDIIQHHKEFDDYDYINDVKVIRTVLITPQIADNTIDIEIRNNEQILYFKEKDMFYAFYPDTCIVEKIFYRINDSAILLSKDGIWLNFIKEKLWAPKNITYVVKLFSVENSHLENYYIDLFYIKADSLTQYVSLYRHDDSLDKILEYYFGSVENYIETYRYRKENPTPKLKEGMTPELIKEMGNMFK